jgi:AI-2 transport protein TqsA
MTTPDTRPPPGRGGDHAAAPRPMPRIVLVLLVTGSLTLTLAGLRATASIIGPAFLAAVLTITVHPLRRRMVRRGMPEWLVSLVAVVSVYFLLFSVSLAVVYSIGRLATLLPTYIPDLEASLADAGQWLQDHGLGKAQIEAMTGALDGGQLLGVATDVFGATLGLASNLFFILTVALFMAFDTGGTQRVLDQVRTARPELVGALDSFARGTRTYMGVAAGFGFIVAVIDGVALYFLGVPGAFVWAVLAFVTNFIPNIGFVIGVIPPALLGLLEGGPDLMLTVILLYSVINVVIQSVIQPRYVGDAVGLAPTITMLSLVFWAWVLGPLGALLAVPLSLLMRALLIEADPDARWALTIVSGRPTEEPGDDAPAEDRGRHELPPDAVTHRG